MKHRPGPYSRFPRQVFPILQKSKDSTMSGLKELIKLELIQTWQMHWLDEETKKKTEKHITAIRINV